MNIWINQIHVCSFVIFSFIIPYVPIYLFITVNETEEVFISIRDNDSKPSIFNYDSIARSQDRAF